MPPWKKHPNPLGLPLIAVAVVFCLSAWLTYLSTVHAVCDATGAGKSSGSSLLLVFFRDHGTTVLMIELVLLMATVGAMFLLDRRSRQQ